MKPKSCTFFYLGKLRNSEKLVAVIQRIAYKNYIKCISNVNDELFNLQ